MGNFHDGKPIKWVVVKLQPSSTESKTSNLDGILTYTKKKVILYRRNGAFRFCHSLHLALGQVVLITCLTSPPICRMGLKMGPRNKRTEDDKAIKHQKKGHSIPGRQSQFCITRPSYVKCELVEFGHLTWPARGVEYKYGSHLGEHHVDRFLNMLESSQALVYWVNNHMGICEWV